jgi:hypothetical protein
LNDQAELNTLFSFISYRGKSNLQFSRFSSNTPSRSFRTSTGQPVPTSASTIAFAKHQEYSSSQDVKLDSIAVHSKLQQAPHQSSVEPKQCEESADVLRP